MVRAKSVVERIRAHLRTYPVSISKKVDIYLSEHLPDLITEYKLSTKKELEEVDKRVELYESDIANLESWKVDTQKRVEDAEKIVERLELKRSVE